jgi:hypothetical protein
MNEMNNALRLAGGVTYALAHYKADGALAWRASLHNLMPMQGRNYLLEAAFKGGPQVSQWYAALYEGDYTPTDDVTAATVVQLATECTAYDGTSRQGVQFSAVSDAALDNTASKASFVMTAPKQIRGLFMSSVPVRGSNAGVLASVVRLPSPKELGVGDRLEVTVRMALVSL